MEGALPDADRHFCVPSRAFRRDLDTDGCHA